MKVKYYLRMLAPFCAFGIAFRILEIIFAVDADTGFFISGSNIPLLFNIYSIIVAVVFFSAIFLLKKENKNVRQRLGVFNGIENFIILATAAFFIADNVKELIVEVFGKNSYTSLSDFFSSMTIYKIVVSVFASLFLVHLASSPKKEIKNKFFIVISLACPALCLLRLLEIFTDMSTILSHCYGDYSIVFLASSALAYMNISKILAGSKSKRFAISFSLIAIFFGSIRLADFAMCLLPGNPYNVTYDILTAAADIFSTAFLLVVLLKISRKARVSASNDTNTTESDVVNNE